MRYAWLRAALDALDKAGRRSFSPYPVEDADIAAAERELGTTFDPGLKEFWSDIGYGFVKVRHPLRGAGGPVTQVLAVMHPRTIAEMVRDHGELFTDVTPFFDTADRTWMVLRPDGMVAFDYDPTVIVAADFDAFVREIFDDAEFFIAIEKDRVPMPTTSEASG